MVVVVRVAVGPRPGYFGQDDWTEWVVRLEGRLGWLTPAWERCDETDASSGSRLAVADCDEQQEADPRPSIAVEC